MKTMNIETTVGEIVRADPARSRIFENLGIEYCCGGKKPLAEACQAKGLDPATVVALLSALDGVSDATTAKANAMTLSEVLVLYPREIGPWLLIETAADRRPA